MKSFKHYITEVVSWEKNSLFVVHPSGGMIFKHYTPDRPLGEHTDEFPSLDFGATVNFTGKSGRQFTQIEKPRASAWGRVDHINKTMHIVTHSGMMLPSDIKNKKQLEQEV